MTMNLTTPLTGAAQTGFTAPTYTLTLDVNPAQNAKQWAVTALGGTQTGVTLHSTSSPFVTSVWRPVAFKPLGKPNPTTGLLPAFPKNQWKVITNKGMLPLAGQPVQVGLIRTTYDVPSGADMADPANVRAALSAHIGALTQMAAGIGDSAVSGVM